jgi:exopolysaccharide/PEP-CTERM locus tyrosine autokinase
VGKFTKALQKSKKEKKPAAVKPDSTSPIAEQTSKKPEQAILKKQKLMAEQLKRKALNKNKILAEQKKKAAALSKKTEKSEPEKIDRVSEDFDLGGIHRVLKDRQKKEPSRPVNNDKTDKKTPAFEAPGMDFTEDEKEPDVLDRITADIDDAEISANRSQPGLTEEELSTIHKMFEIQTPPDESTPAKDSLEGKDSSQFGLKKQRTDKVEKQTRAKLQKKDIPKDKKIIPISERKIIEPAEKGEVVPKVRPIVDKYELPEITQANFKPSKIDPALVSLLRPESFEAEQFRMLRSNLLFPLKGQTPRTILVTSSVPGEGKTFISTNLAVTLALDIQTHVLLIDCDIRKPAVHRRFGYHNVTGLSEYLAGNMGVTSLLLNTNVTKLKILPGGKPPKNPSELLSSKRMSDLLDEVKNKYPDRYIIIDSPPPKLTAETNVLSRRVDAILIVAKYGKTRREDIDELVSKFGKEKIMGIIVNWFNLRASRYYGYGKYGSYKYYYGKS